jgi:hypothetical protein
MGTGNLFLSASSERLTDTNCRPQIQLRIEVDVSQRDREKCRMLWVAVPGHQLHSTLYGIRRRLSVDVARNFVHLTPVVFDW